MVGIVIVSHSETLAQGVVSLAREMGGEKLAILAAGGTSEPGVLGTDAERVRAAIEEAMSDDGVLRHVRSAGPIGIQVPLVSIFATRPFMGLLKPTSLTAASGVLEEPPPQALARRRHDPGWLRRRQVCGTVAHGRRIRTGSSRRTPRSARGM